MIVEIGKDESIKQLRVKVIADTAAGRQAGAEDVVAIWRKHLVIASSRELRYFDLTQQLEQCAQATFGSIASSSAAAAGSEPPTVEVNRSDFKVITMRREWRIHAI